MIQIKDDYDINWKSQKVACSAFAAQANEQAFHWSFVGCSNECTSTSVRLRTYFSFKYWLQTDSVCLFVEHTPHKRMKGNAVRLHIHIMCFAFVYRCRCGFTSFEFCPVFDRNRAKVRLCVCSGVLVTIDFLWRSRPVWTLYMMWPNGLCILLSDRGGTSAAT